MDAQRPPGVLVAVTAHATERFGQRVASRTGELDVRREITGRVSEAWSEGRCSEPPAGRGSPPQRGIVHVHELYDRDLLYVCRHDPRAQELVVITLWERERLGPARVPRRFTDVLRDRRAARGSSSPAR
ncbi:MAG: hypothetical protein ACRDK2_00255 [Solirubrobacteraceae bacterium]